MKGPAGLLRDQNTAFLSWLILILLALIWGSSFILIKKGLIVFSPDEVGSIRIMAASLALVIPAVRTLHKMKRRHVWILMSLGFLGSLIPAFLFAIAQTHIDSGIAGVLNALTPLWVIVLGTSLFAQKVNFKVIIGMALGFTGTAILVTAGTGGNWGFSAYGLLIVIATICYGLNINLIKFKLADLPALTITSISISMVGPFAVFYLFGFTDFLTDFVKPNAGWAFMALCLLGVMGTAMALIMFNKLVQLTNPIFTSSVTYLIPVVALGWGLVDGEKFLAMQIAGMALILFGVFVANKKAHVPPR